LKGFKQQTPLININICRFCGKIKCLWSVF